MYPSDIFSRMYADEKDTKLYPKKEEAPSGVDDILQTNLFNVMLNRRSQRKFEDREIEDWKLEMIFAAADTAPTAGGFQGFEIYHVKNPDVKLKLVQAANNQPYVNAPVVLVFCMNPSRIKMNFPQHIIKKFSVQDATLAAAYAQLAMQALVTDFVPGCILGLGYSQKMLHPKPKRKLTDLIHEI
jgi:nitroreductase